VTTNRSILRSRRLPALLVATLVPFAALAQAGGAGKGDPAEPYIAMCTGCHTIPGYQASFPRVYRVPKIGGQSQQYIDAALHEYKKGERNNATMQAIAQGLNDEQIGLVAAYFASRGAVAK
jgi:cytochrome c553